VRTVHVLTRTLVLPLFMPLLLHTLHTMHYYQQEFQVVATGKRFTVAANHLKSKGSACTGDATANDGQGNCSGTRTQHMQQLTAFLNGLGRANVLALGALVTH
jgi:predicted extracellular nuclease